jgi:hypothetical protein
MKHGFVYIWFDRKRRMFYIGSHWGTEGDGYVCSSDRLRKAYRRRPEDFRRRILSRVHTNRLDLLDQEQRWLDLVGDKKGRYYNLYYSTRDPWWSKEDASLTVREKISKTLTGRKLGDEHKEKVKKNLVLGPESNRGQKQTAEHIEKRMGSMGEPWNKGLTDDPRLKTAGERSGKSRQGKSCPWNAERMKRKVACPHCGNEGNDAIMKRWHFEKCKNKKTSSTD